MSRYYPLFIILSLLAIIALQGCGSGGSSTGSGKDGTELGVIAAPDISPPGGVFKKAQNVMMSSSVKSATIYYTTDGSEPGSGSRIFSSPIGLLHSVELKAIATAQGYSKSNLAMADFTFGDNSSFSGAIEVEPTTYEDIPIDGIDWYMMPLQPGNELQVHVIFSEGTPSLSLFNESQTPLPADTSVDGTAADLIYSVEDSGDYYFTVSSLSTSGVSPRSLPTYKMTITTNAEGQCAAPIFAPGEGAYEFPLTFCITSSTEGAAIYYTTDGSTPTTSSKKFTGSVTLAEPATVEAFAVKAGLTDSTVSSVTYSPSSSVTLHGQVTDDATGDGVSDANVSLNYDINTGSGFAPGGGTNAPAGSAMTLTTVTDENGYYSFEDVPSGSYIETVSHCFYKTTIVKLTLPPGTATEKDVALTWVPVYKGNTDDLFGVWGVSITGAYAVGTMGAIMKYNGSGITYSGSGWADLNSGTQENLWCVYGAADGSVVYAGGANNTLVKTLDEGNTWTKIDFDVGSTVTIRQIWCDSTGNNLYAGTDTNVYKRSGISWVAVNRSGTICGKSDGSQVFIMDATGGANSYVYALYGSDDDFTAPIKTFTPNGFYKYCPMLFTSDPVSHPSNPDMLFISYGSYDTAWSNHAFLSYDYGSNWSDVTVPGIISTQRVLGTPDGSRILVLGAESTAGYYFISKSTDRCQSWTASPSYYESWYNASWLFPWDGVDILFVDYEGAVKHTADFGATIKRGCTGDTLTLGKVCVLSSSAICATSVGKTTDTPGVYNVGVRFNGVSWDVMTSDSSLWINYLTGCIANPAPIFYGPTGYSIAASSDGGTTWQAIPASDPRYSESVSYAWCSPDGSRLIYLRSDYTSTPYYYRLRYSIDGGSSFNDYRGPDLSPGATCLMWITPDGAHIKQAYYTEWWNKFCSYTYDPNLQEYTIDGPPTSFTTTSNFYPVGGIWGTDDGMHLYAAGYDSYYANPNGPVYYSSDGGANWSLLDIGGIGTGHPFNAIWGTSESNIFLGGKYIYNYNGSTWSQSKLIVDIPGSQQTITRFDCTSIQGTSDGSTTCSVGKGGRVYLLRH